MRTTKKQDNSGTILKPVKESYGKDKESFAKTQYLGSYKALELYDRQYGYLHTQSFASNVRDLSAYCRRMGGTL